MATGDGETTRRVGRRSSGKVGRGSSLPTRIGRHEILGELGRGGMGVVYRARDTRLDRVVALKALPEELAVGREARGRFDREARLLAALEHPHVGAIYGIEEHDGRSYLVLQLVEGESLAARLARGPLPLGEAIAIGGQVASGLAAAHRRRIVHCDLKPGNVMLARDGNARIVDFGIALRWQGPDAAPEAAMTASLGTPSYMSPEQAREEPLDPRTDVWSFGCLLAECLGGRRPFAAESEEQLLNAIQTREPDLSALPADAPAWLRRLVERCLVKDRDGRLQDIDEARRELERGATPDAAALERPPLPRALTTFVGRSDELAELQRRLESSRLVTVTGAAGCGKTRLALEAAGRAAARYPDGTWFAPLASLSDEAHVTSAIARAIGLADRRDHVSPSALAARLREARGLLVLDNCEHLLDEVSRVVVLLLAECDQLVVLCTSREPLGVDGEVSWRVPSLRHPPARRLPPLAELARYDGVRLFVHRATEARPDFVLDADTAPAVAALIERLDGIPLAIELAAARLRVLTPAQVLERLTDRFRLLTGGRRSALERHQTLRAALDWSYELLSEPEKRCLRELAAFAGGFHLEEAARVCTGDEFDVLDHVTALVDKSLVQLETQPGRAPRYRLLESIRHHAAIKLEESGEATDVRTRHRDCYLELVRGLPRRGDSADWAIVVEREIDNLRTALEWCTADPEGQDAGLELAGLLTPFWELQGLWSEAREWLERVTSRPGVVPSGAAWARANAALATMSWWLADLDAAQAHAETALAAWRELGDGASVAGMLGHFAMQRHSRGDLRGALEGFRAAAVEAHAAGAPGVESNQLYNVATTARDLGDLAQAEQAAAEALALAEQCHDELKAATALQQLGTIARDRSDHVAASRHALRALRIYEKQHDRRHASTAHADLGHAARLQGDLEAAARHYADSAEACTEMDDRRGLAIAVGSLAMVLRAQGDAEGALVRIREALGHARAIRRATLVASLCAEIASLHADAGRDREAAALLGAVSATRQRTGRTLVGPELEAWDELVAQLEDRLGAECLRASWEEGAALDLDAHVDRFLEGT